MTITAKFPGKCALCGERFAAGTQINWRKGEPSSHAACAAKLPTAAEAEYQPTKAKRHDDQFPELHMDRRDEEAPAPAPKGSGGKPSSGYLPPRDGGPRRCAF